MPIFERITATIAAVRDYTTRVLYSSTTIARQTVAFAKQTRAAATLSQELLYEEYDIAQISLDCEKLTAQEQKEYAKVHKFTQMLDEVLSRKNTITLSNNHSNLLRPAKQVHEYLAASQILGVQNNNSVLSSLLVDAMHTIVTASPAFKCISHMDEHMFQNAYVLITNTMLRAQKIRQEVAYPLKLYVDISEMLQLLHTLQSQINAISRVNLVECIRTSTMVGDVRTIQARQIDISSMTHSYVNNACKLSVGGHFVMSINDIQASIGSLHREARAVMDYDVLRATQVLAAVAARRHIYYEMQRNFNATNEARFAEGIEYAFDTTLPHSTQATAPTRDVCQLVQLRIAHAIQTYYTYNILEEFIHGILAPSASVSSVGKLQLHERSRMAIAILNVNTLDSIALTMTVQCVYYMHALLLIHTVNKYDSNNNDDSAWNELRTMDNHEKAKLANKTIKYIFNIFAPHCFLVRLNEQAELTQQETMIIHDLVNSVNPVSIHNDGGAQLIKYLSTYIIQLVEQMPRDYFYAQRAYVISNITYINDIQRNQVHTEEEVTLMAAVESINGGDFRDEITYSVAPYIVDIITQRLRAQQVDLRSTMHTVLRRLTVIANQQFNTETIKLATFSEIYDMYQLFIITDTLLTQIQDNCTSHTLSIGRRVLVVGGVMLIIYNPQYLFSTLQAIQHIAHDPNNTVIHNIGKWPRIV